MFLQSAYLVVRYVVGLTISRPNLRDRGQVEGSIPSLASSSLARRVEEEAG